MEPFLGEGEKDVVLAREIAVDRRRAVFDAVRYLADRDVLVALGDEEVPCRIEDGPGHGLALAFLTFFDSQPTPLDDEIVLVNSVHHNNTVRRAYAERVPNSMGTVPISQGAQLCCPYADDFRRPRT